MSICLSSIHHLSMSIIYPSIHQSYHFYLSIHHLFILSSIYPLSIYLSIIYLYLYILSVLFLWGPLPIHSDSRKNPSPCLFQHQETAHISGTVIPFHLKVSTASQASFLLCSSVSEPPASLSAHLGPQR